MLLNILKIILIYFLKNLKTKKNWNIFQNHFWIRTIFYFTKIVYKKQILCTRKILKIYQNGYIKLMTNYWLLERSSFVSANFVLMAGSFSNLFAKVLKNCFAI